MKQIIAVCVTALLAACASAPEAATVELAESKFSAEHAELYIQAETALLTNEQTDEARVFAEQLLASDLSDYERLASYQILAAIKIEQSDYTGAIEALEQVLQLSTFVTDEDRLKLQYNIGHLYLQADEASDDLKHVEAGLAAFEEFEALGGELNPDDLWRNAIMYEKIGRINEAIPLVEQLYEETTDSETKIKAGRFLVYLYNFARSPDDYRDMVKEYWEISGDERAVGTAIEAMNRAGWDQESFEWCNKTSHIEGLSESSHIELLICQTEAGNALSLSTDNFRARLCEEYGKGCVDS